MRYSMKSFQILQLSLLLGFVTICLVLYLRSSDIIERMKKQSEIYQIHQTDQHGRLNEKDIDDEVATALKDKVKVLCWIMTGPKNHKLKAIHIKATWGKRCNILLFMSSQEDSNLPTVALPIGEGRENLWGKTKLAFKHVFEHYLDQVDWFYKADDDTYAIMENLRYMLKDYNPDNALYFGCRFKAFEGYMSGGAGYILSREALKRLVEQGINNQTICPEGNGGYEDVNMGHCMRNLNVSLIDTRDYLNRRRFFTMQPEFEMFPDHKPENEWFWKYMTGDIIRGPDCCSDNAISFHYITPNQLYIMDYLIYHVNPYGIYRKRPNSNI